MTLYKVMARIEETEKEKLNGELKFRWICVRRSVPRGTGEALASEATQRGFRLDAENGSTFYPAHRIAMVEVIRDDMDVV